MLDAAVVGLNNEMLFIIRVLFRRSFFFDFHILRCVLTIFNIYKFISQLFCAVGDSAAQNIFCLPKIQILYICSSAGRRKRETGRGREAHWMKPKQCLFSSSKTGICFTKKKKSKYKLMFYITGIQHTTYYNIYPRNMIIIAKSAFIV